jgi:hypothetical protein
MDLQWVVNRECGLGLMGKESGKEENIKLVSIGPYGLRVEGNSLDVWKNNIPLLEQCKEFGSEREAEEYFNILRKRYEREFPRDLPWGDKVSGIITSVCVECGTVWQLEVKDYVLCEGIGEECPTCKLITTNWVKGLRVATSGGLERWF